MNKKIILLSSISITLILTLVFGSIHFAEATFPGTNGKIAFSNCDGTNHDAFTMNPDGSNITQLTFHPANDCAPEWSADGSKICFISRRDGGNLEVYSMNPDGSNIFKVTNTGSTQVTSCNWTPDGTKIIYAKEVSNWKLAIINADGTGEQIFPNVDLGDNAIDVSIDGKIVFPMNVNNNSLDLFVMNQDGTNLVNISNSPGAQFIPSWTPDGKILFRENLNVGYAWFLVNSDGSSKQSVSVLPNSVLSAKISPDGNKIIFVNDPDFVPEPDLEISVMNIDGSNITQLTFNDSGDGAYDWQPILNHAPTCEGETNNGNTLPFGTGVVITSSSSTTISNVDVSPFHKTVEVFLSGITDVDGDLLTVTIDGITQDESTSGSGKGDKSPDGFGVGTDTASIRSERDGKSDGRVYEISFTTEDGNGGVCSNSRLVGVPHNSMTEPIDSGQIYDSTSP